jgi:hypothetical protein
MCQEIVHVHHIKAARVVLLLPLRFAINFAQKRNRKFSAKPKKNRLPNRPGGSMKPKNRFANFFCSSIEGNFVENLQFQLAVWFEFRQRALIVGKLLYAAAISC